MFERLHATLALTLLLLISVSACGSPGSGSPSRAASEDNPSSNPGSSEPSSLRSPDRVTDQGEFSFPSALPQRVALLALERWGTTTLVAWDLSTKAVVPLAKRTTGGMAASLASGRLAYLVRETANPAKNYLEILDLKQRKSRVIKITPAQDFAVLGFALSPTGEHLTYAEINLRRSRSDRVFWRTAVADLKGYDSHISLVSDKPALSGGEIPVPFAWSGATGKIYLQGLLPFRGMATQGIWSISPGGSGLLKLLPEPSYTGLPRLSSDGVHLAYLSTRIEALPRDYVPTPGAPPGNTLAVMDLLTGERTVFAEEAGAALGVFTWSATGKEILASRREWLEGRFRDVILRKITRDASTELQKIAPPPTLGVTGIEECLKNSFFWVEEDRQEARLVGAASGAAPTTFLTLPEGKIRIIGCLGG